MEKKEEKKVCCICGKEYEGYGYNPFPVKVFNVVKRPVPGKCTSAEPSRTMI